MGLHSRPQGREDKRGSCRSDQTRCVNAIREGLAFCLAPPSRRLTNGYTASPKNGGKRHQGVDK